MNLKRKLCNKKHDTRIDRTMLHPWLDYRLGILLKKCAKKGIYLIITEGYRSKAYQDALYAKGRTKPGKVVTNAKGSTYSSQHMWGIPNGATVDVLYAKGWYMKVRYRGKVGYVNRKFVK